MIKKIVAIATILSIISIGIVSFAAETIEETSCSVCNFEIVPGHLEDVPVEISQSLQKYEKPSVNHVAIQTESIQTEMRKVLIKLEKEGVDSRYLFGNNSLKIYATDAFFDGYAAFTVWYGENDTRNGIVFGGLKEKASKSAYKQNVAHEFAHMIYYYYFDPELIKKYRELRGLPSEWNDGLGWGKRPSEIFAEDFAQLFGNEIVFHHRGDSGKMNKENSEKIKKFIVESILKKQNPKVDLGNEAILKRLRAEGIISFDDFLLCELSVYASKFITNEELMEWLYALIDKQNPNPSFASIYTRSEIQHSLEHWRNDDIANSQSASIIFNAFSRLTGLPVLNEKELPSTLMTKGEAGSILERLMSNYVKYN